VRLQLRKKSIVSLLLAVIMLLVSLGIPAVYAADKDALDALIAEATALNLSGFNNPASTWAKPLATLEDALTYAQTVSGDAAAEQAVIDSAAAALKDAIDGIIPNNGRPSASTAGFDLEEVRMVDPDATKETKSLFAYLKNSSESRVLFGHQQDVSNGISGASSDTYKDVNTYPAVVGLNYTQSMATSVRNLYNMGIICEINAHGGSAAVGGNMTTNSGYGSMSDLESVAKCLPGYSINASNATYYNRLITYLDNVANTMKSLTVSTTDSTLIPVIFRPWHEHNGDWFWWDCTTATEGEFKQLFRFTVEYLRDIKDVHNVIYAFSPNGHYADIEEYLYGYPGDDIIDILGIDIYWDGPQVNHNWWSQLTNDMRVVSAYAKKTGKIAALTEFGLRWCAGGNGFYYPSANTYSGWGTSAPYGTEWFTKLRDAIINDEQTQMAYMATWANFTGVTQFWVPYRGYTGGNVADRGDHELLPDFIKYYNQDDVLFADRLGNANLYNLEVKNSVPLPALIKVEAPVWKQTISGSSYRVLVYPRPEKDDGIASVTIQLGNLPPVAAEPYSAGSFTKYYSAVIDTTQVSDGKTAITAVLTTEKGKVITEVHDISVRNGAVPVIDYTRIIDDFESYDNTNDNRTDLNRTWARASNAGSLPSGWSSYVYGTDTPDMNALRLRPSPFIEGSTALQMKYDNLNQNRSTTKYFGSSIVRRFVPIGTNTGIDWTGRSHIGFWVKPDSKDSELCFSIIVGTGGNANYFRARYATLAQYGFDKTKHNVAQYVKVPISAFRNNSNAALSEANLRNVTGFAIAIYGDSEKGNQAYMSGLNDLEFYLFDDIKLFDPIDRTALNALLAEFEGADEYDYTAASWADFGVYLVAATSVSSKEDWQLDQETVDKAVAALAQAKSGLVLDGGISLRFTPQYPSAAGETISAVARFVNDGAAVSGNLIVAIYNNNGTLRSVNYEPFTALGGKATVIENSIILPADFDQVSIKAFVWDDNYIPLCDSATFALLKMVNEKSTPATRSVFAYLKDQPNKLMFGHQTDETGLVSGSDTVRAVSDRPAVYATSVGESVANIRNAYARGQIISAEHHIGIAAGFGSSYGNTTTGDMAWGQRLVPGNAYHANLINYLRNTVAPWARSLTVSASDPTLIPIIYRPWHEHNGDWFWWNTPNTTEGEMAEIFRITVEYLRDVEGITNFIYAFSPNGHFDSEEEYLYAYPGDEYIDLLGIDIYWDVPESNPDWFDLMVRDCRIAMNYANKTGKAAALTECGLRWDTKDGFEPLGTHEGNNRAKGVAGLETRVLSDEQRTFYTTMADRILGDNLANQIAYMSVWRQGTDSSNLHFWVPFTDYTAGSSIQPTDRRGYLGDHQALENFREYYANPNILFLSDTVNDPKFSLKVQTAHNDPYVSIKAPVKDAILMANPPAPNPAYSIPNLNPRPSNPEAGKYRVLVYPTLLDSGDTVKEVTVYFANQTLTAVEGTDLGGNTGNNNPKYYYADIDITADAVADGRHDISTRVVTSAGKVLTAKHSVKVANTPVPARNPYVIDDFESYDPTDDNRTDLERVWFRDSGCMVGLRLREAGIGDAVGFGTGNVLRLKYDTCRKGASSTGTITTHTNNIYWSGFYRTYSPTVNWTAVKKLQVEVQSDGKPQNLAFLITAGGRIYQAYARDSEIPYDRTKTTPQTLLIDISSFKLMNSSGFGVSIPSTDLASVSRFSVRMESDPGVYFAGLNASEFYLFDDIRWITE